MEKYCSTGQSPQRAVAPTEEDEERRRRRRSRRSRRRRRRRKEEEGPLKLNVKNENL